jgi:hypothetical protein
MLGSFALTQPILGSKPVPPEQELTHARKALIHLHGICPLTHVSEVRQVKAREEEGIRVEW